MAKIKMSKKATSIDMTAMCDVAFLLLTFFILTATAKQPEVLPVDTPASTVKTKLPDKDLVTITIGGTNKVFYGVLGKDVRMRTLELMGQKYGQTFTSKELEDFSLIETFGVPMNQMNGLIKMKNADRNKGNVQTGIPHDSIENQNELKDWIYYTRTAMGELGSSDDMKVAIKGDGKENYPSIQRVMDILQDQKINNFFLLTGLRGKDF